MSISGGTYEYPAPTTSASLGAKFDLSVLSALAYTSQDTAENTNYTLFRGNGTSTPHWSCGINGGSFNGPLTTMGTYSFTPSTAGVTPTNPHVTMLTADGATATTYYDGAFVNSGAYTAPTYAYGGGHRALIFGSMSKDVVTQQKTRPTLGLFWNRALSAAEVKIISNNPWQIFAPAQRNFWLPSATAGAYTITALAGTYAVLGQNASLLRSKLITPLAGAYLLSGQPASLSKGLVLLPAAGAYAINGQPAIITHTAAGAYLITALTGQYLVTGQTAVLTWAGGPSPAGNLQDYIELRSFTERRGFY